MSNPKVLLLGDSIRRGYDSGVKAIFKDKAEVYYPDDNCRYASFIYRYMHEWPLYAGIKPEEIDCVHWNAGLWDCLVLDEDGPITPLEIYKYYIDRVCRRMKKVFPNAKYIFAASTPMKDDGCEFRRNDDIKRYNEAAKQIAGDQGMLINDLYEFMSVVPKDYYSDLTHFYTIPATIMLSRRVSKVIGDTLGITVPEIGEAELLSRMPEEYFKIWHLEQERVKYEQR